MPKRLILNQVTLCADGSIGLQWLKQVIEGDEVLFSEPHRSVVDFNGDIEGTLQAVNEQLAAMGYVGDFPAFTTRVKAIDAVGRADPVIEAERTKKIEQAEAK